MAKAQQPGCFSCLFKAAPKGPEDAGRAPTASAKGAEQASAARGVGAPAQTAVATSASAQEEKQQQQQPLASSSGKAAAEPPNAAVVAVGADEDDALSRPSFASAGSAYYSVAGWTNCDDDAASHISRASSWHSAAGIFHVQAPSSASAAARSGVADRLAADASAATSPTAAAGPAQASSAPSKPSHGHGVQQQQLVVTAPHAHVQGAHDDAGARSVAAAVHIEAVPEERMASSGASCALQANGLTPGASAATRALGVVNAEPSTPPAAAGSWACPEGASASTSAPLPAGASLSREALVEHVMDLYGRQGRLCKACQVVMQYCKANGVPPDSLQAELQQRQLPDLDVLMREVEDFSAVLRDLSDDSGWQLVRDDELRLQYKHLPSTTVHAFRARCTLDAPVEQLLALAREVDLAPSWNTYLRSATELRQRTPADLAVYMRMWMPWPISDIGFVAEAAGAELLDEAGCFCIRYASPHPIPADLKLPPGAHKDRRVRMLRPSVISFSPLPPAVPGGPERTLAYIQAYIETGIRNVPGFIITWVLKILSPFIFSTVKKLLVTVFKKVDAPLPRRIVERPELYGLARQRADAYLAALRAKGAVAGGVNS